MRAQERDSRELASGATERVGIVTGASSGIGLHTALGLARTGMRVVMVGRDRDRTEAARRFVSDRVRGAQVETALADFASLAELRRLAAEILAAHDRLDLLVNNAGLFSPKFQRSADGYELTFAVNHLAPFLLTNLLLDRLKSSVPARIVTVASRAHRGNRIDLATIAGPQDWTMLKSYGRSKLCNILFTRELARRLQGSGVVAVALHPGVVATGLGQRGGLVETRLAADEAVDDQHRKGRRDFAVSGDGSGPGAIPPRLCRRQGAGAAGPGGARRRSRPSIVGGERAPRRDVKHAPLAQSGLAVP